MNKTIRVKAVQERMLPWADPDGVVVPGRYVGLTRKRSEDRKSVTNEAMPEGEDVPDTSYYHRAIRNGDLELAKETG